MKGHFIRGVGDGSSKALDTLPFVIHDGAQEAAAEVLATQPETETRLNRVADLIAGFESTYGLELLASIHWAATRDASGALRGATATDGAIATTVTSWNERKGKLFTPPHVSTAIAHLRRLGLFEERTTGWLALPN